MHQILIWLFSIEIIGLISFIFTFKIFYSLNDRGFAISKMLGISILGLTSWLISISNIIPRHTSTLYILLTIATILAVKLGHSQRYELKIYLLSHWKKISWLQSIYFVFFAIFILIRYFDPLINHTEQPMDLAFLTASINTISGIPLDPWLKGETINYYYFGYWIFSDISKISFLSPEVAYNLAISTIPALLGISIAGLTINLVNKKNSIRLQILIGTSASIFSCFLSNTYGILAFLHQNAIGSKPFWNIICVEGLNKPIIRESFNWYPSEFWWWFSSTRIINFFGPNCDQSGSDYTITEFPFFSYLIGDLHPHVMSSPFIIMFITICLVLTKTCVSKLNTHTITVGIIATLTLSICNFINMWNAPILIAILFMVFIIKKLNNPTQSLIKVFLIPITISTVSFLIIFPYIFNVGGSVTGIYASHTHTKLIHGLIIWLPLWTIIIPYVIKDFITSKIYPNPKLPILIATLITSVPWIIKILSPLNQMGDGPNLFQFAIPVSLMVFITAFSATNHTLQNRLKEKSIYMYVLSLGFILVLIPELFYIGDIFENRMNTIFKLYYHAWLLFSLGAAYILKEIYCLANINMKVRFKLFITIWVTCIVATLFMGLYFIPASITSKLEYSEYKSLNGLVDIQEENPGIYAAIQFVRNNMDPQDGILEAVGEWDQSGIFSRTTGTQNILNWPGHQIQWRGISSELNTRNADIETIYKTDNNSIAKTKLDLYSIKYGVIGPQEILKYGNDIGNTFEEIGEIAFQNKEILIYKFTR